MAEVKKARLFLRRGTDTDRKTTVLCEGELGYSTDAFRLFIGDGSSDGGRTVGTTVHVSGGSLSHNFHTKLTEASAFDAANTSTGGFAVKGDLAIFPASAYKNANDDTVTPTRYATTVMLLTAAVGSSTDSPNADDATSWVAINSGIPWGNLAVLDDDISGDKIHGGTISGDPTFSSDLTALAAVTLSGVRDNAENATAFSHDETKIWPLGITGSSVLTAVSSTQSFTNTAGGAGTNYYWDDFGAATGGNGSNNTLVEDALSRAINATGSAGHSTTVVGDIMYIRWGWRRNTSGGNGSGSSNIVSVIGFLKYGTAGAIADWVQISRVYHGNSSGQSTSQGMGGNPPKWPA
jgi:hypothetical protein